MLPRDPRWINSLEFATLVAAITFLIVLLVGIGLAQ